MSKLLLCSEPVAPACPPWFGLRVSGWLNETNFVNSRSRLATPPPQGLRLRWNWPFMGADPHNRVGYPRSFHVLRSEDLSDRELLRLTPSAGHLPRIVAPRAAWKAMHGLSNLQFEVPGRPCSIGDAVYFELTKGSSSVDVTLGTERGAAVQIRLVPGDSCYYELAGLRSVVFSSPPQLVDVPIYLSLRTDLKDFDVATREIAVVDARIWSGLSLAQASTRLATAAGEPFTSLAPQDWQELAQVGRSVIDAHDANAAVPQGDIDRLIVSSGLKWETALLMGWGFLDGEHPPGLGYDQIVQGDMMKAPNGGVYGYQIVAAVLQPDGTIQQERSSVYFASAMAMAPLAAPRVRVSTLPRATSIIVNQSEIGSAKSSGPATESVQCRVAYTVESSVIENELLFMTPLASASTMTGEVFGGPGEMIVGTASPVSVRAMTRTQSIEQNYQIPFFDSEVWTGIAVGDHWDRYLTCPPTAGLVAAIDYKGAALGLETAACDSPHGTAGLKLLERTGWLADRLARYTQGRLEFLARILDVPKIALEASIGPAFLHDDRCWAAPILPVVPPDQRERLVDGTLSVGAFIARITGFETDASGASLCLFEGRFECGKGSLYEVDPKIGTVACKLEESESSLPLWKAVSTSDVQMDGALGSYFKYVQLKDVIGKDLATSMVFTFATRMAITFKGKAYFGSVTPSVAAPYLHAPPEPPTLCANVQFIGSDYYGREMVRIRAEHCDRLNPTFLCVSMVAPGPAADESEVMDKTTFAASLTRGLFGAQKAYRESVLFNAFTSLANAIDNSPFTLGVSYVRPSDSAESDPARIQFFTREVDPRIP